MNKITISEEYQKVMNDLKSKSSQTLKKEKNECSKTLRTIKKMIENHRYIQLLTSKVSREVLLEKKVEIRNLIFLYSFVLDKLFYETNNLKIKILETWLEEFDVDSKEYFDTYGLVLIKGKVIDELIGLKETIEQ
jgi:hypothetical protein